MRKLPDQLAAALRRVHAKHVTVTPDRVSFTGGILRLAPSWNILVPFTRGELVINAPAKCLEYSVSFRQLIMVLSLLSVVALGLALLSPLPMLMIAVALAILWLWIGGMNIVIGKVRFERFLRTTLDSADSENQ